MKYWTHWHNIKYELDKRIDRLYLTVAHRAPARLRMWMVVSATNEARKLYPSPGYDGPDGLSYKEIYDGALRERLRK